jgi:cytoskeleton protein RodZ
MAVASTVVQAPLPQHPTSGSGPESMRASPDRSVSGSERIGSSAPDQMGHTGPAVGEGQKEPVVADRATPEPAAAPPPPDIAAASAQPVPTRELLAALGAEATEDGTDAGRVTLLAHEPSWIQVRSNDREFLRTKTLEAGERFPLPNRADLALWTGNAGGLEIIVDGRSIGMLGARGRVLKDVSLAPDALRSRLDTVAR